MPLAVFPKCFLDQLCVTGEMTVDDWLDLAGTLDVDGYEFYWGFTPWQNPAELERIRRRVEDAGRSIPMMCFSPDFTRPARSERLEEVEKQKEAILATARLGGRFCRVLSGQRRPEVSREAGIRWVVECIHEALPAAEAHGVVLILENHYKDGYWSHPEFAQKADVFLELVDAIGPHPYFGINYDPSNAIVAGDDPIMLLEAVKHRVVSMHASDRYLEGGTLEDLRRLEADPHTGYAGMLKHGVIGQGMNDYDRIFTLLREAGFQGWVSIEDGQDPAVGMDHLRESAVFLRERMRRHGLT
ncbi:MAG: sugar phosphate isomerase/epimerase family protein [Rhodothermales bacterium]|nr:sugar phosphate isomerase/epimerase family protein [Rhodothermales bacterium]